MSDVQGKEAYDLKKKIHELSLKKEQGKAILKIFLKILCSSLGSGIFF